MLMLIMLMRGYKNGGFTKLFGSFTGRGLHPAQPIKHRNLFLPRKYLLSSRDGKGGKKGSDEHIFVPALFGVNATFRNYIETKVGKVLRCERG